MTNDATLSAAYAEWRSLAETEGEAIRTRDWTLLAACQHALTQLQDRITSLTDLVKAEWARLGKSAASGEAALKTQIAELIEMERRNQILLNGICDEARTRIDELDHSRRNLKRIQRSYVAAAPAAWHSFS